MAEARQPGEVRWFEDQRFYRLKDGEVIFIERQSWGAVWYQSSEDSFQITRKGIFTGAPPALSDDEVKQYLESLRKAPEFVEARIKEGQLVEIAVSLDPVEDPSIQNGGS